jgi:hypothetical protein
LRRRYKKSGERADESNSRNGILKKYPTQWSLRPRNRARNANQEDT